MSRKSDSQITDHMISSKRKSFKDSIYRLKTKGVCERIISRWDSISNVLSFISVYQYSIVEL